MVVKVDPRLQGYVVLRVHMLIILTFFLDLCGDATERFGGKWYKSRYSHTPRRFYRIPSQVQGNHLFRLESMNTCQMFIFVRTIQSLWRIGIERFGEWSGVEHGWWWTGVLWFLENRCNGIRYLEGPLPLSASA